MRKNPGNVKLQPGAVIGWHSRGYLPHFDSHLVVQHVTFHLADSLPSSVLACLEEELRTMPPPRRAAGRRVRIEAWIDAGQRHCPIVGSRRKVLYFS